MPSNLEKLAQSHFHTLFLYCQGDCRQSEDTKEAGEMFYRQAVVALMSRFGGTFELGHPYAQGHYKPAHEDLVPAENCPPILHSPKHPLVHPGIILDASMLMTRGSPRPVSPLGLLFLLDVVLGSPHEQSRTPRSSSLPRSLPKPSFSSVGRKDHSTFLVLLNATHQAIHLQLRDTDHDDYVHPSSDPYEQWGSLTSLRGKTHPASRGALRTR
ncbi:uncharacterized protein EDB91DRAFT_700007 [Suillus paluster]|uniref:uncharacterized protein n=1 Tax=Suillus paluster TaxID=48578 RepID=UPI001B872E7E|nr:uncharacterized protein EDB91DRAFT_700007 [Suillus paluster]KAG1750645.1 hypothetical protein EDB91DRAFT_700007 [Suillus paluster]